MVNEVIDYNYVKKAGNHEYYVLVDHPPRIEHLALSVLAFFYCCERIIIAAMRRARIRPAILHNCRRVYRRCNQEMSQLFGSGWANFTL